MWWWTSLVHAAEPFILTTDRSVLDTLEQRGFLLGEQLADVHSKRGADLAAARPFQTLVDIVETDQAEAVSGDRQAGSTMGATHRAFDPRWLTDTASRYDLVAVANRPDRVRPGQCGELRLVYRLAAEVPFDTPLPFSMLLVYPTPAEDCAAQARLWLDPGRDLAVWLADQLGALGKPAAVELDWQTVRWPSSVRADIGGHAEYVLRVLAPRADGGWDSVALENTPDVERILADPALLRRATTWALAASKDPLLLLPDELRATKVVTVTPGGLSRLANRPWAQLGTGLPEETVRALDANTCQGCHAIRSTAGFHLPGQTRDPLLGLAVPWSPYLGSVLAFRLQELNGRAQGQPVRPLPPVEPTDGSLHSTCTLAESRCEDGLVCLDLYGDGWGTCEAALGQGPGAACEQVTLTTTPDSLADRAVPAAHATCIVDEVPAICRPTGGGFPGGLCRARCDAEGSIKGDTICASMQEGAFTECLGQGRSLSVCLAENKSLFWIDRCDAADPCREGYVCSSAAGAPVGAGACRPTYALPELRVDTRMTGRAR